MIDLLLLMTLLVPAWSAGQGDVQIGRHANAAKVKAKTQSRSGIYPVYVAGSRWMLVDRETDSSKRRVGKGKNFVVIGSRGIAEFRVDRTTKTWVAACEANRSAPRTAYLLTSNRAKDFKNVGTPIIALLLPEGKSFDTKNQWFYALRNEVKEDTYQKLQTPIRQAIVADVRSGAFQMALADEKGHEFAKNPAEDLVQMKIDFGSKIKFQGLKDAFILIDGTQISNTYRRCMRLFSGTTAIGNCAEMPHELHVETRQMQFVAYDPNRRGKPYIFGYTDTAPLWGHERWGFHLTKAGPQLFIRDALDPRCREGF